MEENKQDTKEKREEDDSDKQDNHIKGNDDRTID